MKTEKLTLEIKWYKNDSGGDQRGIAIDYIDDNDLKTKKNKILNDFKKPMDIDMPMQDKAFSKIGKIPYSVKFI